MIPTGCIPPIRGVQSCAPTHLGPRCTRENTCSARGHAGPPANREVARSRSNREPKQVQLLSMSFVEKPTHRNAHRRSKRIATARFALWSGQPPCAPTWGNSNELDFVNKISRGASKVCTVCQSPNAHLSHLGLCSIYWLVLRRFWRVACTVHRNRH